ncbi:MAG: YraN family protein [Bacillota bacterium]
MTKERITLGRVGEEAAASYLKKNGLRIIKRNYRCKLGELDIVAMDGPCLVFIEVRTKAGNTYGLPQESLNEKKKHKLRQLAVYYTLCSNITDIPQRFDVIAVTTDRQGTVLKIEHIKNAL